MATNVKVKNFYDKHRSNIILASHTQTALESILIDLFQEMYDLGHADGYADYYYDHREENDNSNK